ncbi:MAG: class I SAM-dependent methyltransferase [archaeon]|nr:MAG: class I SAM-dependent methyltransferase [archaeon]
MRPNEEKLWTGIILGEDLDKHMDNVGQAEINAKFVKDLLKEFPLETNLLVEGCGTGQMFDYISPSELGKNLNFIFADITSSFLGKVKERLNKFPGTNYKIEVDDIENTKIKEEIEGILIVLVLQHVEWQKALESMSTLEPKRFYIITQEQPKELPIVTDVVKLPGTINRYAEMGQQILVKREELIEEMKNLGYRLLKDDKRTCPGSKIMAGFVFEKK